MSTHVVGGMTIQPATLSDLGAIEALEAAAFTGDRLSRRSLRAFVLAKRRPLIVARFGERVAGYALVSTRRGGRTARIYSLAVDPAQARRGVGRALLQACERYARPTAARRSGSRCVTTMPRRSRSTRRRDFPVRPLRGLLRGRRRGAALREAAGAGRRRGGGVSVEIRAGGAPTDLRRAFDRRMVSSPPGAPESNRGRRDGFRLIVRRGSRSAEC